MAHPIAFHGLSAYSRRTTPEAVVGAAKTLESALFTNGAEICVADRPIGPVGVVVQGRITYAWAKDVYSVIDDTGHRVPQDHTTWDEVPFMIDPDHDLWVEWAYRSLTEPNRLLRLPYSTHDGVDIHRMKSRPLVPATQRHRASRHYAEGWLAHPQVVALWVKTHVPRDPHHPSQGGRPSQGGLPDLRRAGRPWRLSHMGAIPVQRPDDRRRLGGVAGG